MTAETLRDIVCPRGNAAEGADAKSRTVRPDFGDHRHLAGGASRPEVGDWRGAYRSRSCGGPALSLSGMRRHVRVARPSTGSAVAAPGHVPDRTILHAAPPRSNCPEHGAIHIIFMPSSPDVTQLKYSKQETCTIMLHISNIIRYTSW
jgi:hypothetical protein